MTLALHLTPEQASLLHAEAERAGLTVVDYTLRRLFGDCEGKPGTVGRPISPQALR